MHALQHRKLTCQKIQYNFRGNKDYLRRDVPAGEQSERRVLTHLPIPKVIFTSSAGCIMYDRVNQLETRRGREEQPALCRRLPCFHHNSSGLSLYLLSSLHTLFSPSSLYLTPTFDLATSCFTHSPHSQKQGNPQQPSIFMFF